jgi:hypothetical protein
MHRWLKLSHRSHSGRLKPHEYTSYGPLLFLLIGVGVILSVSTAFAAGPHPPPQAGSIGLTGEMPGPAPTVAATIAVPGNGESFTTSPITVRGNCPKGTLVEIFKNNIFAGSTACDSTGNYSISVDLLIGQNQLVARVFNSLNEQGPDSNVVTVYYNAAPFQGSPIAALNLGGNQLLIVTNAVYRGTFPGQQLSIPITVLGGTEPYAVNIQWGDSSNTVVPRNNNLQFFTNHVYKNAGTYQVTLQASDSQGRVAFLTVAAIVNGNATAVSSSSSTKPINKLLMLWPLYTAVLAAVISFWLGERREKHILDATTITPHFLT